jgi:hypothetical protein
MRIDELKGREATLAETLASNENRLGSYPAPGTNMASLPGLES